MHHDALEFPDGRIMLLTRLREGQRAAVLQMPAASATPRAAQTTNAATTPAAGVRGRTTDIALGRLASLID